MPLTTGNWDSRLLDAAHAYAAKRSRETGKAYGVWVRDPRVYAALNCRENKAMYEALGATRVALYKQGSLSDNVTRGQSDEQAY
jgi:hypothetical protein